MTIKQLLEMPVGKENRAGGFDLTVKIARKSVQLGKKFYQWVVFIDETGEIPGEILLHKYDPLIKNELIHVVVCWLQMGETGKKLFVEQWGRMVCTSDEGVANYEALQKERQKGMYQVYAKEYEEDIPGMCATHIIEGFINGYTAHHGEIPECTPERMKIVNEWVAFNMDGHLAEMEKSEV